MSMQKFILQNIDDWKHVIDAIMPELESNMVIALSGPLGAGKTTFVQLLAEALGSKSRPRSPSFALIRSYKLKNDRGIQRLVHADAYRIESGSDGAVYGLDEYLEEPGNLLVVEWPENLSDWLREQSVKKLQLKIEPEPDSEVRRVTLMKK